jgi:hypothetical protein
MDALRLKFLTSLKNAQQISAKNVESLPPEHATQIGPKLLQFADKYEKALELLNNSAVIVRMFSRSLSTSEVQNMENVLGGLWRDFNKKSFTIADV